MNNSMTLKAAIACIVSAILLSACATKPADPTPADVVGGMKSEDAKSAECVTASIVGGLIGGMIAEGTNTLKGTAAGAGIGMLGCVAVKANTRQNQLPAPAPASAASSTK
jgi:hypothetical protein